MSINIMNNTSYKSFTGTGKKASLKERFQDYMTENGAFIVGGLMMMNNNGNAYAVYKMLGR